MDSKKISIRKSVVTGFSIAFVLICGLVVGLLHEKDLFVIGIGIIFGTVVGFSLYIYEKLTEGKQKKMDDH